MRVQAAEHKLLPLSVATAMSQLPLGAVKIPFGELRRAAPEVFTAAADCDAVLVALPLGEVLSRINLAKLARRADQQVVQVPEDITSPFGPDGRGLTLLSAEKPAGNSTRFIKPANAGQPKSPSPLGPIPPRATAPAPPSPAVVPVPARIVTPPAPETPITPIAPIPFQSGSTAAPPKPVPGIPIARPVTPVSSPVPPPPAKIKPAGGNGQGFVPIVETFVPSPSVPVSGASAAAAGDCLTVPVTSLMNNWPQTIRLELAQMAAVESAVAFPLDVLEKGLRAGKVAFPWKLLRAWMRPVVPPHVSAHDAATLEIPLSVIAPLFVSRRSALLTGQRKVAVDENIPDLFFNGVPSASSGISNAAPVNAPVPVKTPDTNYYVWGDTDDTSPSVEPAAVAPASEVAQHFTTPNEVVQRAMALEGVVGALVALPDGLKVASEVPKELNADTLAAFLPQLFGKVSQASKELRMGELNNLSFTVGNVPWRIFRVHSVYFAAFGRAGQSLPKAQLTALAAELDRKPRTA